MRNRFTVLLLAVFTLVVGMAAAPGAPGARAAGTATPVVTLTSTPNPSAVNETVTLTAKVVGDSAYGPVSGTVTFKEGATVLGTDPVDDAGVAEITTSFSTAGDHLINVEYSGGGNFVAVTTVPRTQVVATSLTRKTWVAPGGGNWSTASNWSPAGAPVSGDTLVFEDTSSGQAKVNDIAGLTLAHIAVTGTISGNGVTLSGALLSRKGAIVQLPIALSAGQHTMDGPMQVMSSGVLSGTGGLRKSGPDTVTLQAANTYTGPTEVNGGIVVGEHATAFGTAAGATTVAAGATAKVLLTMATTAEPFTLAGQGAEGFGNGALSILGSPVFSGAVTLTGDKAEVYVSSSAAFMAPVSGTDTHLVKSGGGTMSLRAANTFKSLEFNEGTVHAHVAGALGTGAITLAEDGYSLDATLSIEAPASTTRAFSNPIVTTPGTSAISVSGPGTVALNGTMSLDGGATFVVHDGTLILNGAVSGAGGWAKDGEGALWLAGAPANTITKPLSVAHGAVVLGRSGGNSLPAGGNVWQNAVLAYDADHQIGDAAAVTVAANSIFDMYGFDDVMGPLTSSGAVYLGILDTDAGDFFTTLQTSALQLHAGELGVSVRGGSHDQVKAPSVKVGGTLLVDGDVPFGSSVKIIDNTGGAAVSGTFAGLPEGATVTTLAGSTAIISYKGGDGNDVTLSRAAARSGYWMMDQSGKVYPFGDAKHYGDLSAMKFPLGVTAVDIEPTADYKGYWILLSDGGVFAFGNAPFWGSAGGQLEPGERATSLSNDGYDNYWIFTDQGVVFDFDDAGFYGDMFGIPLNGPVLGSVGTPSGEGYYMVASDGGIFAFGDAKFRGSMGGKPLNGPVKGLAPDPDGDGYWLVATDGGIFAFNSSFKGSMGGRPLNRPVIGMVAYGDGYLMVASDGGIFNFSTKPFVGSLGKTPPPVPVVAVAPLNER